MAQFESRHKGFEAAGVQVVFIAAEKRGGVMAPEKYFLIHPFSYPFLVDEDRAVTKAYGVYHWLALDAYNIAHPATFVLDRKGVIRSVFVSENQRDRVSLEDVLKLVRRL